MNYTFVFLFRTCTILHIVRAKYTCSASHCKTKEENGRNDVSSHRKYMMRILISQPHIGFKNLNISGNSF